MKRAFVALMLMCTQDFIYNAFTFTQGLILGTYFQVPDWAIPFWESRPSANRSKKSRRRFPR